MKSMAAILSRSHCFETSTPERTNATEAFRPFGEEYVTNWTSPEKFFNASEMMDVAFS